MREKTISYRPTVLSSNDNAFAICFAARCIPLLIQQNVDGSDFFNRSWAVFKVGFNDTRGNYWIGNDLLSQLTQPVRNYKLRFDLQLLSNSSWYWAEYSRFAVLDEFRSYELRVSGYSGNIGDALSYQHGAPFTTYDRDNDARSGSNCAAFNGGGFWYKDCSQCNVNGIRDRGEYLRWYTRDTDSLLLQSTRMWLMC